MTSLRYLVLACLVLSACSRTPNDVSPIQQTADARGLESRQAVLAGHISSEVAPSATGAGTGANAGVTVADGAEGNVTFLDPNDLTAIAQGAIDASEGAAATGGGTGGGVFDNIQPQQASDVLPPPLIPRVAAFALRTTHQPGERQYRRNPFRADGQSLCLEFETRDEAQDRFLRDGGPDRDPNGMDADGDGFVCGFDPSDLRASANAPAETFGSVPAIDG